MLIADPTAQCGVFDWTKPRQIDAYFALHEPFERQGVDFFWFDWCCDDSSAVAPGLTADTWINSLYAREQRARGSRWPAFARVGASYSASAPDDGDGLNGGTGIFAEHRSTIQFTGDTCATWQMLAFEAQFTASEAAVGLPYVSHDIGSFNGQPEAGQCSSQTGLLNEHLPDDLYARWVAFGTFQPLDRLHSNHGDRLPWEYGAAADAAAAGFLRLREALDPYLYTLARRSYDTGLPIAGPLYLQWPGSRGRLRASLRVHVRPRHRRRAGHRLRRSGARDALGAPRHVGRLLHRAAVPRSGRPHPVGPALADAGAGPRGIDRPDPAGRTSSPRPGRRAS